MEHLRTTLSVKDAFEKSSFFILNHLSKFFKFWGLKCKDSELCQAHN